MISFEKVAKSYEGHLLFKNLSFTVYPGEHIAILAESGAGKTTLLRMISGLESPDEGRVFGVGKDSVAYMFQEPRLIDSITALENVAIASTEKKALAQEKAAALLSGLGLSDALEKYPAELSGGMKQRVSLARTFMVDRPIFLLDEPFSALDPETREQAKLFVKGQLHDKTLFLVTHNAKDADDLCERRIDFHAETPG